MGVHILHRSLVGGVDVEFLCHRTTNQEFRTQCEALAQGQVQVETHVGRELRQVVALDGDFLIGNHICHQTVKVARRYHILIIQFGGIINIIDRLQEVIAVVLGLSYEVTPTLGSHRPHAQATAYADIFVEEVGTLGIHRRGRVEIDIDVFKDVITQFLREVLVNGITRQVIPGEADVLRTETHAHRDGEERRVLAERIQIVAQQALTLEDDIAQGIAQLS